MACLADFGIGAREAAVLSGRGARTIYVIGDSDTGKTTLAGVIVRLLAAKFKTAAVDLDAGQATIGLPTTFAWKMAGKRGKPDGMYFAGTTSPTGYLDRWLIGAASLVGQARGRARKVVVDSCGLACGAAGRELHHATVDAVRPDVVVAIERGGELAGLLGPFVRSGWPRVVRASVPARIRKRSRAERRSYRCGKFRAYFERARELRLDLAEVAVLREVWDPAGRLASLRDGSGRDVALGIVQKFDSPRGTITVLSPVPRRVAVRAVVLGSMRIARDGRQLARNV